MKTVFISDLHLSPDTPKSNQLFYKLLRKWQQNHIDALYILGDFFDYWLGDDDDNEFIRLMKTNLKAFAQTIPTYFIKGNHDFAIGKKFSRDAGIKLLPDCTVIKLGNTKILLTHGDVFCSLDLAHQRLKKIIQNKIILWLILRTPLSWRKKIKQKLENKSSQSFNTKPEHTYLVVDETITKIANRFKVETIIHGHTHRPGKYHLTENGTTINRIEIPDWADNTPGGYVYFDGTSIEIIS